MKMTTNIRQVDGVVVVDISGRMELGKEGAALRDLVSSMLEKGDREPLYGNGGMVGGGRRYLVACS